MCKITYRHWQPGDDDAILAFLPNTNEEWFRNKFDYPDDMLEPEGIRLAFVDNKVVGYVMGDPEARFIEEKQQNFGYVSAMFVAPDMRRKGIASRLMHDLIAYFKSSGFRGSILDTDDEGAIQLYKKVGYKLITRELQTIINPTKHNSLLKWTHVDINESKHLHKLRERWSKSHFPVRWNPDEMEVDQSNINDYRVLRSDRTIIGYVDWSTPSRKSSINKLTDPIVPDVDPLDVIRSLQQEIDEPTEWQTCEGSRYEDSLRSLGYKLQSINNVSMYLSIGKEIDLTNHHRCI
ncbi:MAG: GNAT family N-acetyltransferase [Candidatus Poribacteria bacterium]|nr:GNAT family N-acetyltransferase [Candidatus Poribacteria bacterium]